MPGGGFRRDVRDQEVDRDERHEAERGDEAEGRAPAEVLADEGAERDAEDVGERQAEEHQADGAGLAVGRHHAGGDHGADPEERAVGEGGEHAGGDQQQVVRGDGRDEVADDEDADHHQQHALARQAGGQRREDRRADHHAERVGGDELAGERDRHGEVAGDVGQKAHDHELGGADAEGAHGERQHRDRQRRPTWGRPASRRRGSGRRVGRISPCIRRCRARR